MFKRFFVVLTSAIVLYAQGSDLGQVRGTITDPSEAAVPSSKITITDVATGASRDATASGSGEYEFGQLKPGAYRITFSAKGFNNLVLNGVQVVSGVAVRADARLEVAKSSESVTVTTEAAAVQTDSPTITGTLSNRELVELPRDSRDIYNFLYLNPNITERGRRREFQIPRRAELRRQLFPGRAALQRRGLRPADEQPAVTGNDR